MALTYGQLTRTHPEYDAEGWTVADLLYAGGKKLKKAIRSRSDGDKCLVDQLFPRHVGEEDMVYEERRKRAFDIPYAGQIVDGIVSAVFSDTMTVELDAKPLDEGTYWHEFIEDVSPPGGKRIPLRSLLREQMRCAQLKRRAWTLVDLPARGEVAPANRHEEERSGLLDAYAVALDPLCVTNWRVDKNDELQWAVVRYLDAGQRDLGEAPGTVHVEYTVYTPVGWRRWAFSYVPGKGEPKPDDPIDSIPGVEITEGFYAFGRVPLVRHELPDGLWSMGKLEPLAIEHLNKENATAWGEYRALFSLTCFFLEAKIGDDGTEAQNRALSTRVGPGRGWVGGAKDRVEVISSPTDPVVVGREGGNRKRDEMFRVVHQMSQSVDTKTAATQKQSGESKKQDKKGEALVYEALGELTCEWALDVLLMAAAGRGEQDAPLTTKGMNSYDDVSLQALVDTESVVETIPVRSQTFQRLRQSKFAEAYLEEDATPEVMATINKELEENISSEEFAPIVQQDPTVVDEDGEPLPAPPPPVHGPRAKPPRGLS